MGPACGAHTALRPLNRDPQYGIAVDRALTYPITLIDIEIFDGHGKDDGTSGYIPVRPGGDRGRMPERRPLTKDLALRYRRGIESGCARDSGCIVSWA